MRRVTINGQKGFLMALRFTFKPGCPPLCWGKPDSPRRHLCGICHGALPEVPLMMWQADGSGISLCDDCTEKWIETIEKPPRRSR